MKRILLVMLILGSVLLTGCNDTKIDTDCINNVGRDLCIQNNYEFKYTARDMGEEWYTYCNSWTREKGITKEYIYFSSNEVNSCTKHKFGDEYYFKDDLCKPDGDFKSLKCSQSKGRIDGEKQ